MKHFLPISSLPNITKGGLTAKQLGYGLLFNGHHRYFMRYASATPSRKLFLIGCFFPLASALLVDAAKRSDICRLLKRLDEMLEVDQTWETTNNETLWEVVKRSNVFIQHDIG